jgi:hypothetical protein
MMNGVYDGGAAFTRGGFGCVFKPALRCMDSNLPEHKNYVSKLVVDKYGKREYRYIYNIKKKLQHLPSSIKKYFLLDNITMCRPKPLSNEDKEKIEEVCGHVLTDIKDDATQEPINSQNINNNLDKFKIINMPMLSIDLSNYIKKTHITIKGVIKINNIIITYVTRVIPTLYKNGVIHGDIKSENMMFNNYDNNTLVLIDWGLSYLQNSDGKDIPDALFTLSTQWHHPFSSFLFKIPVIESFDNFLQKLKEEGSKVTRENIRPIVMSEYKKFENNHKMQIIVLCETLMNVYGEELNNSIEHLSKLDIEKIINDKAIYFIVEYVTDILMAYIVNYKLELDKYFNEVYVKNVDTWGVLSIYIELIDKLRLLDKIAKTERKIIMDKIMNIIIENLYKNGNKVINIHNMVHDIKLLNEYLTSISNINDRSDLGNNIRPRDSNMLERGNIDTGVYNKIGINKIKKSLKNKGIVENKLENYSNVQKSIPMAYLKKTRLYAPGGLVRGGGRNTRNTRKNMKYKNPRK